MHQPIGIGTLRTPVENGIDNLGFHFGFLIGSDQINQIGGTFGNSLILAEINELLVVIGGSQETGKPVFDPAGTVPHDHNIKNEPGEQNSKPTTMDKLEHIGGQEGQLNQQVGSREQIGQ
jgi:hypothetical protein